MSRTTSQTSTASGNTANMRQRGLSLKTNTANAVSNRLQSSDIKLFVTNLRLLDLDRQPDWPNITVQTFFAKNAEQKQRIGAVEWSLFRLFEIWDPAETSQKLQPFFPPLEPLQSRNLRIALHRSLDALKKDGVLGRETVLRKTMLDECKGEKFFEILALFSAIVLKKTLASQPQHASNPAIARTLATSSTLSNDKMASLLPLAIAHKAALVGVLREKEEKRRRYAEFGDLLHAKAAEINQRIRKAAETPRPSRPVIPQKEADAIKKQLKDNWIGDQKWVDVMLHGDDTQTHAVFLNTSFKKVWRAVDQGRRLEDAVPEVGLLENLQLKIDEQQARLQKWQDFYEKIQGGSATNEESKKTSAPFKEFKFDDHLQLQLPSQYPADEPVQRPELRPAYQDIIVEMDEELLHAASARYNQSTIAPSMRGGHGPHCPVRRQKSRSDLLSKKSLDLSEVSKPVLAHRPKPGNGALEKPTHFDEPFAPTPPDSETTSIVQASALSSAMVNSPTESARSPYEQLRNAEVDGDAFGHLSAAASPEHTAPVEPPSLMSFPPASSSYFPSDPSVPESPSLSNEEALAAQIVSTIADATPSPVKKYQPRPSLMERTRMSMVRSTSFEAITESPALPSPSLLAPPTAEDRNASLIERTRLSMAAMSLKPRTSLAPKEKRSHRRQSTFPVNQFDTPRSRKSFQVIEEEKNDKTPKEDLFSDDVDYDRVFKSRPKIATSPIFGTPADERDNEKEFDVDVTGVDLADVDCDEDDDTSEQGWENSPLRRMGKERAFA